MEYSTIYQILKMQYGALAKAANEAGVTTQTLRNILIDKVDSAMAELVIAAAVKIADEILQSQEIAALGKINELTAAVEEYKQLRNQLLQAA